MHAVSCQPIRMLVRYFRLHGIDPQAYYSKLATIAPDDACLRPAYLENPRNTMPWASFVTAHDAAEEYLPEPADRLAFFEYALTAESTLLVPLRMIAGLVTTPRALFRLYEEVIGPLAFGGVVTATSEILADGRLIVRLSIPPECRPSRFFFEMSGAGIAKMPKLLGLGDARVQMTTTGHGGEYVITLPKSATLWARLQRFLSRVFSPRSAFEELAERERELREEYAKLLASESALQATRAELEARVKALNTLAGGISHEINNVLQGVVLSLEGAESEIEAGRSGREKLQAAKKFAQRGMDVMDQVLTFSREAKFPMKPISPVPVVREAVEMMKSTLSPGLDIRFEDESAEEPCFVMGDETRLQQVLINLCANAAYAMRANGGEIRVRTSLAGGRFLDVEVVDIGEGIPESIRERLFDPFFTTKPMGHGSGMGLSVVHGIVRAFGGEISIDSELGRGTRVRVRLPVIDPSAETRPGKNATRLLVVDDEAELLEVLREALEDEGYAVTTSGRAEEALRILHRGGIDLVLADYMMPGLTGIGIAREIKSIRPDLPVLLFTGVADFSVPKQDRELFHGILSKPLDRAELVRAIRAALGPAEAAVGPAD